MEYISLGIFIVLIAQFLFYVKKKNEILFNKIKNIFLVKEIAVPLFYFLWRMGYTVLEFRLNIKEYFLLFIDDSDKVVLFYLLLSLFFKINEIKFKTKKIEFNIFLSLFVVLSAFTYEYFYDLRIWIFIHLILLILNIIFVLKNKNDFSFKISLIIIALLSIIFYVGEYLEDRELSNSNGFSLSYKNKLDLSNFDAELVEKDNIIMTNRFKIKFNGSIVSEKNPFIEKKYKNGVFYKNIINYKKIDNKVIKKAIKISNLSEEEMEKIRFILELMSEERKTREDKLKSLELDIDTSLNKMELKDAREFNRMVFFTRVRDEEEILILAYLYSNSKNKKQFIDNIITEKEQYEIFKKNLNILRDRINQAIDKGETGMRGYLRMIYTIDAFI